MICNFITSYETTSFISLLIAQEALMNSGKLLTQLNTPVCINPSMPIEEAHVKNEQPAVTSVTLKCSSRLGT